MVTVVLSPSRGASLYLKHRLLKGRFALSSCPGSMVPVTVILPSICAYIQECSCISQNTTLSYPSISHLLCVLSLKDQKLPRVFLDRIVARRLGPLIRGELGYLGDDVFRLVERVLSMRPTPVSIYVQSSAAKQRLTTAVKSSEYSSCASTLSTWKPINVKSPCHAWSGCLFRILRRILHLPCPTLPFSVAASLVAGRSTTTATMSTYAALPRCWTQPGYEGPLLYQR
jgi:hypothetical protein